MENLILGGIAALTTILFFSLMDNHTGRTGENRFEKTINDLGSRD